MTAGADSAEQPGGAADRITFLGQEPPPPVGSMLRDILNFALPNILGFVLTFVNELTNTVFLGHAGNQAALAAVGLGNMMQNCFGLSVGLGICSALDPQISQAYGAEQHELSCHALQRCRVLVSLQLVWMIPVLWFSEQWLGWIHQDLEVARDAGEYNRASIWGLFAAFQFEATRKFLQNRGQATVPAVICAVTAGLHICWCSFFVLYLRLGNQGAGCANAVTWWSNFALSSLFLARTSHKSGLRKRSVLWIEAPGLREWLPYMKLALPATVQVCSEWWFWELCALIVGYLGKAALSAHVATLNWLAVAFMPVVGLSASTATLVGNALGANLPRKARATVFTCICLDLVMWAVLAGGMLLARAPLASAFSDDKETQAIMRKLLCTFSVAGFFDSAQNVMGGGLRGMGMQQVAAVTYIVSFYGVMLPASCAAAFALRMGVFGIWACFAVGTGLASAAFLVTLCRVDFGALAAEAAARLEREGELAKRGRGGAAAAAAAEELFEAPVSWVGAEPEQESMLSVNVDLPTKPI